MDTKKLEARFKVGDIFYTKHSTGKVAIVRNKGLSDREYECYRIEWLRGIGIESNWKEDFVDDFDSWINISSPVIRELYDISDEYTGEKK